jgi:hypothetical protein
MVLEGDRFVVTSTDDVKTESYARVSDAFRRNGCSYRRAISQLTSRGAVTPECTRTMDAHALAVSD